MTKFWTATFPAEDVSAEARILRLTQRDVEDARRLLQLIDDRHSAEKGGAEPKVARQVLQDRARAELARRQKRYQLFGRGMFGEPAWDMMLWLYVRATGQRQTISGLADLAGASKSTALRWLDYLHAQGLVDRQLHPTDKRAVFVKLTEKGLETLEAYLSGTG